MKPLVAIRITDSAEGRQITGFTSRGKNRRAVWSMDVPNSERGQSKEKILKAEEERAARAGVQLALPGVKGA